jgi:hypothetical protein
MSETADLVYRLVQSTSCHLFLTGRAGTGKTTLLKRILKGTHKKVAVAAPTGIAAINAGGVTLHSLFQLPFGVFIPEMPEGLEAERQAEQQNHAPCTTAHQWLSSLKMHRSKRQLIERLELLIIDEVSMLRADMLDAVDAVCRHIRRRREEAFGGLQLLFIGDLYQLPPVVTHRDEALLNSCYDSPYFFSSKVLCKHPPHQVELTKVYRQSDERFIELLNRVRDDQCGPEDMNLLKSHVQPQFSRSQDDGYIQLTTHNHSSDATNDSFLQSAPGQALKYPATIEGDFPENQYPMALELQLKLGVQVMFVKNDASGEQRYFNGKIGWVSHCSQQGIRVDFKDGSPQVQVEPYRWENKRYALNAETGAVEETVLGSFVQYPLKLAWAITIHKSQGLTFDKAIIDASKAFAPGQVYVALSRLTSLKGLVLTAPLAEKQIQMEPSILEFCRQRLQRHELEELIEREQHNYVQQYSLWAFDFERLSRDLGYHLSSYNKSKARSLKQNYQDWARDLRNDAMPMVRIAEKFSTEIRQILTDSSHGAYPKLQERMGKAIGYFEPQFKGFHGRVVALANTLNGEKGSKSYVKELHGVAGIFFDQIQSMLKAKAIVAATLEGREVAEGDMKTLDFEKLQAVSERKSMRSRSHSPGAHASGQNKTNAHGNATAKTPTHLISFELYKKSKDCAVVAKEREFARSTVEGHLAKCISEGLIPISEMLSSEKIEEIMSAFGTVKESGLGAVYRHLDGKYSYAELKYVLAHLKRNKS